MTRNSPSLLHQSYTVERSGNDNAPWCIIHRGTEFKVPVRRPYPGPEPWLPPIDVCNFRSRAEAEAAAQEIDWASVDEAAQDPEVQRAAAQWRKRRDHDAAFQVALANARAGLEPFPWEPGGFSRRDEGLPVESVELTLFNLAEAA